MKKIVTESRMKNKLKEVSCEVMDIETTLYNWIDKNYRLHTIVSGHTVVHVDPLNEAGELITTVEGNVLTLNDIEVKIKGHTVTLVFTYDYMAEQRLSRHSVDKAHKPLITKPNKLKPLNNNRVSR